MEEESHKKMEMSFSTSYFSLLERQWKFPLLGGNMKSKNKCSCPKGEITCMGIKKRVQMVGMKRK